MTLTVQIINIKKAKYQEGKKEAQYDEAFSS